MQDKRFALISKDRKFRRVPKTQSKVKIDNRFQSMFTDKKFQVNYTTDQRGRPVKHQSKEDLKRYYELSSEESESEEEEAKSEEVEENKLEVSDKNDKKLTNVVKEKLKDLNVDYARGERSLCSESSSDDEESEEEISESEEIDHKWGELDGSVEQTEEATYRLAACNLDWDRIRATDLMVLFTSFLPAGGVIQSVTIYPSEFGKQRLQEEEMKGPIELVEAKPEGQSDDETEEGSKYHMEKLRQYQLNRLKYYYAVVAFDSAASANKIYTECEGMEYESSGTKIDLRFIPDDMTFDDPPKESCEKLPEKYTPRFFTTTALQQAKVDLTWDETNPDRLELAEKLKSGKIDDISEQDLQNYLAGSSDEEEQDEVNSDSEDSQSGNAIDKYKALLQDIQDKEEEQRKKDVMMEITWDTSLQDKLIKEKPKEEQTPFEKYLDKKKEKRKERRNKAKSQNDDSDVPDDVDMNDRYFAEEFDNADFKKTSKKSKKPIVEEEKEDGAELELLLMNEDDDGKKHFDMKKIQKNDEGTKKKNKKKKKQEKPVNDEFEVNVEDKRFSALFTSHHYNIDPTDPHFKKTKGMETLIDAKLKRRNEVDEPVKEKKKKKNVELNMIVKNVKRNAQGFKKRK